MMRRFLAALPLCLIWLMPAHATTGVVYDRHAVSGAYNYGPVDVRQVHRVKRSRVHHRVVRERHRTVRHQRVTHVAVASYSAEIVAHPSGCPMRAFCGCGASIEVFGRSIRELWLAANWFKFPPAEPAPGMVAVRRHHVFVIRQVIGPGRVLAYDANSGGRKTRIHERSLSGYSVRNPRGSRYATAG